MQFQTSNNSGNNSGGSRTLILVIILILVLFSAGGYFYYSYFMNSSDISQENLVGETTGTQEQDQTGETGQINPVDMNEADNESVGGKKSPPAEISGTNIGDLFIPSKLDIESIEFLQNQINLGELPIKVSEGMLGKNNPFLK